MDYAIFIMKNIVLELEMKKANEQVDLSSSEDEISPSILKEAIDQQFLNDNLYTGKAEFVPESSK